MHPTYNIALLPDIFRRLYFLAESSAYRVTACIGVAALDVHMLCAAAVVRIVYALHYLTVNAYCRAWVGNRARVHVAAPLVKALAARILTVAGMLAAYLNISLAAAFVLIIRTAYSSTV